jgi:hypothetical protein
MSHRTRIALEDTVMSAITKMAEGNPGAASVCVSLYKDTPAIDPDAGFEGMAHIFQLDILGIYGSRIWMLYKDVCGCDVVKTIAVLRSVQLGITPVSVLDHAIDNEGKGLDINKAHQQVSEQLPKFSKFLMKGE